MESASRTSNDDLPQHHPSLSSTNTDQSHSKLTRRGQLVPPMKCIGSGVNSLRYAPQSPAWDVDISRDGQWLAVCYGAPDPCVRIWRKDPSAKSSSSSPPTKDHWPSQDGWVLHSTLDGIHERTIRSVAFCPLAKTHILAAASFDASVSIWEFTPVANGTKKNTGNDDTRENGSSNGIQGGEWECTTQLEGHDHEIKAVTWNATGSLLATCGRDKTVWVWETWLDGTVGGSAMNEFECIAVLSGSEGDVKCIQFAPSHGQWGDGDEILISAGYDDTIRIWAEDAGDWYCAMSMDNIHNDTIWSVTVAPGGGRLVSSSADGSLAICKTLTRAERVAIENNSNDTNKASNGLWKCVGNLAGAHSSIVYSLDYAPAKVGHGRIVSGGGDSRIQIYREVLDSTPDKPMFALDAAVSTCHGDVNCVKWHPFDGSTLFSVGDDATVQIWNFEP